MKKILLPFLIICTLPVCATAPNGYYNNVYGKAGTGQILDALFSIISSHTDVGYTGLYSVYPTSDVRPGTNQVWDMYSTCTFIHGQKKCGTYNTVCDCYNREHSVPQSWFGEATPMKSDAFHVVPTDGKVNGQRSNNPYGECAGGTRVTSQALGRLGSSTFPGYSGTVFEPDDQYKGDFARGYFYMVACYYNKNFTQSGGNVMFTYSNGHAGLTSYAINLLLKWHREDPVSQKELDRNEAIYAKQHNRNPFIDHPCLAEYIWGDKQGETVSLTSIDICNGDTTHHDTIQPDTTQFRLLPVTDIHSSSAILHWTDAHVAGYTVDVYEKEEGTEGGTTTLVDDLAGSQASKSGYTDTQTSGYIRLGSGSNNGKLTYANLSFPNGGTVVVTAKQYSNDAGAPLKITAGTSSQIFTTTGSDADYTLNVAPQNGTVSVTVENSTKGQRVYVRQVVIVAGVSGESLIHVQGYPQNVGNVLQHQVVGLEANTTYYYTVQPDGMAPSQEAVFFTENGWTGWDFVPFRSLEYRMDEDGVLFMGIPEGADIRVYDTKGQTVDLLLDSTVEEYHFHLAQGLNLISVTHNGQQQLFKLIY